MRRAEGVAGSLEVRGACGDGRGETIQRALTGCGAASPPPRAPRAAGRHPPPPTATAAAAAAAADAGLPGTAARPPLLLLPPPLLPHPRESGCCHEAPAKGSASPGRQRRPPWAAVPQPVPATDTLQSMRTRSVQQRWSWVLLPLFRFQFKNVLPKRQSVLLPQRGTLRAPPLLYQNQNAKIQIQN